MLSDSTLAEKSPGPSLGIRTLGVNDLDGFKAESLGQNIVDTAGGAIQIGVGI